MPAMKILIIDDDPDMQRSVGIRLKANRHTPCYASDASTALSVAQREAPDVIILDIGLPGGDGFMVLDRLKAIPKLATIPVIVVSGKEPLSIKDELFQSGAAAYFTKPVSNEDLLDAIEKAA